MSEQNKQENKPSEKPEENVDVDDLLKQAIGELDKEDKLNLTADAKDDDGNSKFSF